MRPTPTSCAALLAADPSAGDGLVALDPDGPGGSTPFIAFCLMSVQGGGWTQVASLSGAGVLTDSSVGSFATDPFKLSTATINRLFANAADRRVLMDFGQGQLMEFKFASPWGVAAFQSPMWSYPPATSWFGPCATPASGIGAPSLIWIRAACTRLPDGGSASCACAASGHESGLFGSGFVSSDNAQVFPGLGWSSDFKVYVR